MEIAIDAIDTLGVRVVPATASIARDAVALRSLGISLADGFALGTARAHGATVATFDRRVRRGLRRAGFEFAPALGRFTSSGRRASEASAGRRDSAGLAPSRPAC